MFDQVRLSENDLEMRNGQEHNWSFFLMTISLEALNRHFQFKSSGANVLKVSKVFGYCVR